MARKTALVVLTFLMLSLTADAAMFGMFKRKAKGEMYPETGDVPDLVQASKPLKYKGDKFAELYGSAGNRYLQYGLTSMMTGDYFYGGREGRLTIELATMDNPTSASGLFHHHRGQVIAGRGTPVEVGAEGVLDSGRENRTLYFYRSNIFVKIVYSGKKPVPDLSPIARYIDERIPGGNDAKPEGLDYIDVQGVNKDTVAVTPGFTFNMSFLPAAVWASAPGGGSVASDLFIITRRSDKEAADLYKDYFSYLKLYADYVEEYRRDRQRLVKAVDPNQGRVLFTAHRNALIIAARPDGYEKGEVLIDAVTARIDELKPGRKK